MKITIQLGYTAAFAIFFVSMPVLAQSGHVGNDGQSVNGDPVFVGSNGDLHNNGLATSGSRTAPNTTVVTSDSTNVNGTSSPHYKHKLNHASSSSSSNDAGKQ